MSTWNRELCWAASRARLKFQSQGPDPSFLQEERLFFRFKHTLDETKRLPQGAVQWPHDNGTSCNRSKYSQPQDVLFPCYYLDGVFAIPHDLVLGSHESPTGARLEIRLTHEPARVLDTQTNQEEENYAHCNLRNHDHLGRPKSVRSGVLKSIVRARIREAATILSEPTAQFPPISD